MKRVLVISQVIPQWYVDTLTNALGSDYEIDFMTGSTICGNVISSPKHDPRSLKSRLVCWWKHYCFAMKWLRKNKNQHYDLVFAVSNPPINPVIALKMKRQFHAPFVYMNWDLYPQVIATSIKNPVAQFVCKLWSKWNSCHFKQIDRMLTIGDVMAESLNADLDNPISVTVVPIAVDTERLKPIPKEDNPFCRQYGLTDNFVVLYSGKMGLGHNIEVILETAELLKENKDIKFVFIGDGPKYNTIDEFIRVHSSENILLLPFQSEKVFPLSMACGDIGIVSQEETMAHLFMPSKAYSMMSCGQAIVAICTDHDDLYALINSEKIGVSVTTPNADVLAAKIENLFHDKALLDEYQKNARMLAKEKFGIGAIEDEYRKLFEDLMEKA